MQLLAAVAFALVASASAAPSARMSEPHPTAPIPEPCPTTVVPTPTPTADCEPDLTLCVNMPEGLEGVMVPNVGYPVSPAIYCKSDKCESMTLWCQHDKKGAEKYLYCCGDHCEAIPANRTCEVDGKEYTVGFSYEDVKVDGEKVDYLWCVSEDEYVTCSGKECSSTDDLTPPGVTVCAKPIVKPTPPPMPRPDQCMDCKTCTSWGYKWTAGRCSDRCIPDALCFSNPTQCDAPQPPKPEWNMDCVNCIRGNNTWQVEALGAEAQCHDGLICPRHLQVSQCTRNINDCRLH